MKKSAKKVFDQICVVAFKNLHSSCSLGIGKIADLDYAYGNIALALNKFGYDFINVIYFNPIYSLKNLANIEATDFEKVSYIEWYISSLVDFYKNISFADFLKLRKGLEFYLKNVVTQINLKCFNSLNIPEPLSEDVIRNNYDYFWNLALTMFEDKNKGIPYLKQEKALVTLGVNLAYLTDLLKKSDYKLEEKKPAEIVEEKTVTIQDKPEEYVFKKNGVSKNSIKAEISKYFDLQTLENKGYIDEETTEKIVELMKKLDLDLPIRKIISDNNVKLQNKIYSNTLMKLINEENLALFDKLTTYLEMPSNLGYKDMFNSFLKDINGLVKEFIESQDDTLINDYQEQIALIFEEIRGLISYLPDTFDLVVK